ncbi:DNA-binding protein [Promicromonospora sp. NPDC050880]|uniref:DNA-binding protein n=1 Tax=Promicromonospora sp. NPDC050880 TaxID=3364406 RepID=UPI0037989541
MRTSIRRSTQAAGRLAGGRRLVPLSVAAEVFCVSVKTIRRRIADGTVTGYRIGRLIRVDLDEMHESFAVPVPNARGRAAERN